ncbi:DUF3631 domain-containing protein [Silvimonas sp.]|uniref:DUF3631 domain-containing protein n=1 Tax=Silvimonas sp. TaxID=2650811 RepID=UPI00283E1201|nr:DUF3631 domain-containing protein [Silvimonas sp.]MDR3429989.1 DUF3631 domain-containing protein [Silvimonas sp.]
MNAPQTFETGDRIQAALAHVAADDRAVWYRMGMAVKSELGEAGFALWDNWSQSADSYNAKSAKAVWKGIKETGGVTIASLFHEAMQHGYKPATPYAPPTPEQRARLDAERAEAQRLADEDQRQQRDAAKAKAARLWETTCPVLASHPYVVAKGIKPMGAKQLRNMLVLPLRVGGDLVNLQFIGEDGNKRFCTGGQVKGTALVLGQLKGASEALLCEGWATGCSLHEATGLPVVVGWNAGNLSVVAERLSKVEGLALIVAGDCDASGTGQQAAINAARAHGNARWCVPSFTDGQRQQRTDAGKGEPSDFNDLHQLAGLDAMRQQIGQAIAPDVADGEENAVRGDLKENSIPDDADTPLAGLPDASDEEAYLIHLAGLKPLAYARIRKAAGEALGGIPLGMLDKLVAAARKELLTESGKAEANGTSAVFDEVEPWPTRVNGAAVLDDAFALLCRYVIADRETLRAAALWCAMTWYADYATVLPLALITAPEKGCGKSTLLAAMSKLSKMALPASNLTSAVLFRAIEKWHPALFIDEADTFMKENPELVGVINSGHTRDMAFTLRTVGDDYEPRKFSTWGPKAISGIGSHSVAETITSRSVVLMMRRKLAGEQCENLRHRDPATFVMVQRQFARWADDHGETFAGMRPTLDGLSNRTADNWEPLLALADLAGGEWPRIARIAAHKLTGSEDEAPSFNEELLGDIKAVFERLKVDRIHSADLIEELCRDEEAAWATYNRGRPVTGKQLSRRLKDFGIKSSDLRIAINVRKGYKLEQFADVFTRYLLKTGSSPATSLQGNTGAASSDISIRNTEQNVADRKTPQPSTGAGCSDVADRNPQPGHERESEAENDWLADYEQAENVPAARDDSGWEMTI